MPLRWINRNARQRGRLSLSSGRHGSRARLHRPEARHRLAVSRAGPRRRRLHPRCAAGCHRGCTAATPLSEVPLLELLPLLSPDLLDVAHSLIRGTGRSVILLNARPELPVGKVTGLAVTTSWRTCRRWAASRGVSCEAATEPTH